MFNAGVITSIKPSNYKLTNRLLGYSEDYSAYYIQILWGGILEYSSYPSGAAIQLTDEWAKNKTPTIGNSFEARATVESGTGFSSGNSNSWKDMGSPGYVVYSFNSVGGRIFVEIRNKTSLVVVASARFWTPGYAP